MNHLVLSSKALVRVLLVRDTSLEVKGIWLPPRYTECLRKQTCLAHESAQGHNRQGIAANTPHVALTGASE